MTSIVVTHDMDTVFTITDRLAMVCDRHAFVEHDEAEHELSTCGSSSRWARRAGRRHLKGGPMSEPVPNYTDYLKLGDLLKLQGGLEEDESVLIPDELLFIVVHQALELWFKIVNRELRMARNNLGKPRVEEETVSLVVQHLRRVNRVLELAVDHFKVRRPSRPGFWDFEKSRRHPAFNLAMLKWRSSWASSQSTGAVGKSIRSNTRS